VSDKERDVQQSLLVRLRRIEGQVRGVQRMIENDSDCGEILNQIAAIKAAVNRVGILVFENYAQDCMLRTLGKTPAKEDLKEITVMMGRLLK
jgi:DNA-binding FrmR family transcriptional regulator